MASFGGGLMRKKILLKGPILTRSGYGEQARFAYRALSSRPDLFELFVQPMDWGHTSWLYDFDEERSQIDNAIERGIAHVQNGGSFDMTVQVTIPNEFENKAPFNIGYTAGIETTAVSPEWINFANQVDRLIVVSNHSKNVFEHTAYDYKEEAHLPTQTLKLNKEAIAVNYPVRKTEKIEKIELDLDYDFNFLCVAQAGPRKNLLNTIKWFIEEFKDEEVGLVVKANRAKNCVMDREWLHNDLTQFVKSHTDRKCKVYLLHGDMTDEEMTALYCHERIGAFITLTHGEGFGLPLFEAAYNKLPVIAPGWSGHLDFLVDTERKEHFYNISFDILPVPPEAVWEGVITKEAMWAYPREQSVKEKMRQCYDDVLSLEPDTIAANAENYSGALEERFSKEKMYAEFVAAVVDENEFNVEEWLEGLNVQEIE